MGWKKATDNYPISINWEETTEVEGVITEKKAVNTINGIRNVMTIETEDGKVAVWESAGLSSLFALEEGVLVKIKNEGMKLNEKTKRRFRSFCVEYYEKDSDNVEEDYTEMTGEE